jgi:MFS family permease
MKKESFLNRDFLLISQGQLVNHVGSQISLVATAFWLRQSTDSASLVGLTTALSALPLLLLGPVGGAVADRWSRRNILIACDLFGGMVSCALAVLIGTASLPLTYLTLGLLTGNLILAAAGAFAGPALNALTPSLVPYAQIGPAMAFCQAAGLLSLIVGQFTGGMLLTHYVPTVLFQVDAATYFVSAGAEWFVRPDSVASKKAGPVIHGLFNDVREGFGYVWRRRGMRALMLAAIPLNLFSMPVIVLLPFYTTHSLGQPLTRYGYLLAGISLGMLIGYAVCGRFPPPAKQRHAAALVCVLGCAVAVFSLAFLSGFWPAMFSLGTLGCLIGVATLICLSVLMQQTEAHMRGRVSAVLVMATQGVTPLAMALVGILSDLLGKNIRLLYGGCGVLLAVTAIVMSANRDLPEFLQSE